jgi:hypothetical protein
MEGGRPAAVPKGELEDAEVLVPSLGEFVNGRIDRPPVPTTICRIPRPNAAAWPSQVIEVNRA